MPQMRKIGIIGGDKRQLVTAECLSADFECAVWGFSSVYGTPDEKYLRNTVRCIGIFRIRRKIGFCSIDAKDLSRFFIKERTVVLRRQAQLIRSRTPRTKSA